MIVRVFTEDGRDREFEIEQGVTEVIVYTDALVPLGKLDLRPPSGPLTTEDSVEDRVNRGEVYYDRAGKLHDARTHEAV